LGHFALQPERCNKRHIQFSLPMYDITNPEFAFSFCSAVAEKIDASNKNERG